MKRYTWKLAIAFIISYILLMLVVVFAYIQISENFIVRHAKDNLVDTGNVLADRFNAQLDFDYKKLKDTIEAYEAQSLDPIAALYANIDQFTIYGSTYSGFGSIVDRVLSVEGNDYTYIDGYDSKDYAEMVSIYSFQNAFNTEDNTVYIFFKVRRIVAFFEAAPYIESLMEASSSSSNYIVMTADNTIAYRSFTSGSLNFFYDYLRSESVSENVINRIKLKLMAGAVHVEQQKFLGQDSFITFNPLEPTLSEKQFYLVTTYNVDDVILSMSYLTNILWALFFVIFLLFAGALVIIYKILVTKINDIENARITHYYAKPYIIWITGKGKIKSYNQSFKKLLGDYDIYDKIQDFKIKTEFDMENIEDVIHRQRAFTAIFELGILRLVYIRFIPMRSGGGYLLVGDDVSSIEGSFDEYKSLALFNKVTHLPNYNSLRADLISFFSDLVAVKKINSLLAIDIVSFSKINILLGEKSGDRFLVIISELLDESLEGYPATLYNTEADSFVIFFKDIENYNWVTRWINKILSIFEKPITIDKNFINIDVKIGVFHIESDRYEILNADVAYENMNLALNHAKESNTHKHFTYDVTLSMVASREQMMEKDLANAIKNQEFYMALQPQYDNSKEMITGFEALIRWKNPKYISESPLKFIQMAERNNMIIDIGRIALHETCMIAKEMEKYNVHISLNISPVQLLQAGFVNEIITVFEQYDLKKHSISLEITETFLIGSFELVINKLKLLQKYGFDIHLDDFGTGYSSLQYLRDLPINTIKIDRAFIINLETDAHSRAIVQMISSLARNVGLEVIAEGIENEKQNLIVVKSGCNIIQGYMISPPVVKSEAIKLLIDYNIDKTKRVDVQKLIKPKEIKR
ncbi:MAG: GGDEF domain-containing phosphodiesterase [Acholeplasmataceae bacterium]|nr:GGDEF domain-containing phosphodiesterase [Acholeplasmataceae bacterium]